MDELCLYLKNKYPENYICGREDCNLLLWGIHGDESSEVKCCTLTVGVEYSPLMLDRGKVTAVLNHMYRRDKVFHKLYRYGKRMCQNSEWPFLVIAYPAMREEYNGVWERSADPYPPDRVQFYCKDVRQGRTDVFAGADLKSHLYDVMNVDFEDAGTAKKKNKSLADYFQFWSRSSLSARLTKFDLDGFLTDRKNHEILIEIKRSKIPKIPEWRPYQTDKPDYVLQDQFARRIGAEFWVLHHEPGQACTGDTPISFFNVRGINPDPVKEFLICKEQVIPLLLEGTDSLETRVNGWDPIGFDGSKCYNK